MKTIKLRDQMGVVRSFQGEIIPGATNDIQREDENGRRPRWVEMQAYRHADGGYVLHRNGRTAPVYHRIASTCADSRHVLMHASELPSSAMACPRCNPPEMNKVAVEQDRPIVDRCLEPEDIVRVLTEYRQTGGGRQPYLSRPAEELLKNLAKVDPDFAESWEETEVPI